MKLNFVFKGDGTFEAIGVSLGGTVRLVQINQASRLVVFKVSAGSYYGGQGRPRGYAPARYVVFGLESYTCSKRTAEDELNEYAQIIVTSDVPTLEFNVRQ